MARLELQYLYEVGRVTEPASVVFDALHAALGLVLCDAGFGAVVRQAERYTWTRDPFDRLIVAQAALHEASLITKDRTLHANYPAAVW
jgi:PIN domain nuclease of toxin-antitoxin system